MSMKQATSRYPSPAIDMFEGETRRDANMDRLRVAAFSLLAPSPGAVALNVSSSNQHVQESGITDNSSKHSWSLGDYLPTHDDDFSNDTQLLNNESYTEIASFYDLLINHSDIKMRDDILRYTTPVIIVIGNLSNLMALFVLRRKKLRKNSVCFYMCAYAMANLFILNLMLGVAWFCFTFNKVYVTNLTDWSCRLWSFITNVVTYSGIWFVVAMNIDRLLYTTSRTSSKLRCSVFSAKAAVLAIMTGLIVVSIHAMWTFELQPHGCYVPFYQEDIHILIWPWWSATVYTYLPLFLIISITVVHLIVLCIYHARRVDSVNSADNSDSFVITVIVVSGSFFILAIPATVTNILDIHMPSSWLSVDLVARMELTKKITEILSSMNHVLFGFQLLSCSREFREELAAMLRMVFCCIASKRKFKVFEMRQTSNCEDNSIHRQVDYQLCNNNEDTTTTI